MIRGSSDGYTWRSTPDLSSKHSSAAGKHANNKEGQESQIRATAKVSHDWAGPRDLDAARTLIKLANGPPKLPKSFSTSFRREQAVNTQGKRKTDQGPGGFGVMLLESKIRRKKIKVQADAAVLNGSNENSHLRRRTGNLINEPSPLMKALYGSFFSKVVRRDVSSSIKPPPKKPRSRLSVPTHVTGFSFSIPQLLSAVRMALITSSSENYALVFNEHLEEGNRRKSPCKDVQNINPEEVYVFNSQKKEIVNSEKMAENNFPSLTIHDIVLRVRSKPVDPRILITKEPLPDLIRGILKIFSSETAPRGAAGWKALTFFEKSTKSWSWIGPVPFYSSNADHDKFVFSSHAWGLPRTTLPKLVDSFSAWLKKNQETFRRIGSLPPPPVMLMQPTNSVDRFLNMRGMKSMATIKPSSDEVRAYFREEETLRYLIPDKAYSYTALDGKKSAVAPIKWHGAKPGPGNGMFKQTRPLNFSITCLVRDAASRLPGSVGTRADICTLIRDSQFIKEDISDVKVDFAVSGALDRLHYEDDPCVRFDRPRRLWFYLHGEREEEDFEQDDRKVWKQKKKMQQSKSA